MTFMFAALFTALSGFWEQLRAALPVLGRVRSVEPSADDSATVFVSTDVGQSDEANATDEETRAVEDTQSGVPVGRSEEDVSQEATETDSAQDQSLSDDTEDQSAEKDKGRSGSGDDQGEEENSGVDLEAGAARFDTDSNQKTPDSAPHGDANEEVSEPEDTQSDDQDVPQAPPVIEPEKPPAAPEVVVAAPPQDRTETALEEPAPQAETVSEEEQPSDPQSDQGSVQQEVAEDTATDAPQDTNGTPQLGAETEPPEPQTVTVEDVEDEDDHNDRPSAENEVQDLVIEDVALDGHGEHDGVDDGEAEKEADTPPPIMGGDHHDHPEATYPLPPGIGATSSEVAAYLKALENLPEAHVHDPGSDKSDEHEAAMDLAPRGAATHVAIGDGAWDDPAIWSGGEVPGDHASVLIPPGVTVHYGFVSDASLFTLRIDGKLEFATDTDSKMVFDTMLVAPDGHLEIGSLDSPVDPSVNIDLIVADNGPIDTGWDPMLLSRGIISHGRADIHGAAKDSHEKVIEDPMAGDTSISFADMPEGWQVGDKIVIAGTRYEGHKWDNDILAKRPHPSEDEVRIISDITGNTVHFEEALAFDHDTPRADLKTSVANYTRNVSVESENGAETEVFARGHVMFMHSDEVDVRYAEFLELGRTDKSQDSFASDNVDDIDFDTNLQGRYGLHLHRTGVDELDNPTVLQGNAVFGSPGWGIVHHDANAIIDSNATFDTFGAGYVAETGNETGIWSNNIAIYAEGQGWGNPKGRVNLDEFDTARSGDGFWFQGRLVESVDNIASSVNAGFSYFHRDGDDRMIEVASDNFAFSGALRGDTSRADDVPIRAFSGNETFASNYGLHVVKANPNQEHDVWSHLTDFTAWEVRTGAHLEYTSHYVLSDFDVIGKDATHYSPAQAGISLGNNTTEIVIKDSEIEGFTTGIDLNKHLVSKPQDPSIHNYFVINTEITDTKLAFKNFDPEHDTIISDPDLDPITPSLQLDGPLTYREGYPDPDARHVDIEGMKTDALGTTPVPGGTDNFNIGYRKVIDILEEDGYWTTPDGQNYFILDIYFTERLSGEVYVEHHPVWLDENVPLGNQYFAYTEVKENGVQAITEMPDGTLMAGDLALGTPQKAVPFAHLAEERSASEPHMHDGEMSGQQIIEALTNMSSETQESGIEANLDADAEDLII